MGVDNLVVLAGDLRATTKKGRQLFPERKAHPREDPGYAYVAVRRSD